MFYSCPHCRELVATDPVTRQPPELCPRCGGALQIEAMGASPDSAPVRVEPTVQPARSLATFLRRKETWPPVQEPVEPGTTEAPRTDSADETDQLSHAPADQEPGDNPSAGAPLQHQPDASTAHDDSLSEVPIAVTAAQAETATSITANASPAEEDEALAVSDSIHGEALNGEAPVEKIYASSEPGPAEPSPASAALVSPSTGDAASPSFTRDACSDKVHSRANIWQWAALFVLGIALLLQVLLADRARLAADAGWRPLMTSLCAVLGCTLPPWHQPEAFAMLGRDVRPLRGTPGALQVQATFRNDARWSQSWPVLLLSLSDADGRVVGARAFRPDEYLDPSINEVSATQSVLAPGQSARVVLHLREPAANVVAFSFDFR